MRQTLQDQERLCGIDEALDAIVARHPAVKDIATAFALMTKGRLAVVQALPTESLLKPLPSTTEIAASLTEGKPLLMDLMEGLYTLPGAVVARLLAATKLMLPAAAQAFPALAEDLARLAVRLENQGPGMGEDLVKTLLAAMAPAPDGAEPKSLDALGMELDVSPVALHVAVSESFLALLFHEATLLSGLVAQDLWRRPYCPVCGGGPDVGILREGKEDSEFLIAKAGQLWFHCGQCAALWRFPRLRCASCGSEDPEVLELLLAEGGPREEQEHVHLCKACHVYTTSVSLVDRSDRINLEMLAMSLLPLEILAQERGFAPIAPSPWNNLG